MPDLLSRRALLGAAATTAVVPAASPTPEADALLDRQRPYVGDLDAMLRRRAVRVLTTFSRTHFFVDRGRTRGVTYEYMRDLEAFLAKRVGPKRPAPTVYFVPVSRDRLLPALLAGEGDLVAANLTVTPERRRLVDFSAPYLGNVRELVVTGPASPALAGLDDLAGREVHLRRSSSYWSSLERLNDRLAAAGRPAARPVAVDEHLEDEDLLEMLGAGLIPLAVADNHKAALWARALPSIRVRDDLCLREDGKVAFAIRERSPALKAALDAFVRTRGEGTLFGNVVLARYLAGDDPLGDAALAEERARFDDLVAVFRRFGDAYGFDALMLAAQGYQESRLDQSARSRRGAIGIMQVLPATAADPNVDIAGIDEVENNVHAAAKYMRYVTDVFFADARFDAFNRTMFAFAAYNAGPARIAKARRLAPAKGLDPDQWFGNVEQVVSARLGRETVQYVGNILKYYVVYRRLADLERRKGRALEAMTGGRS